MKYSGVFPSTMRSPGPRYLEELLNWLFSVYIGFFVVSGVCHYM